MLGGQIRLVVGSDRQKVVAGLFDERTNEYK